MFPILRRSRRSNLFWGSQSTVNTCSLPCQRQELRVTGKVRKLRKSRNFKKYFSESIKVTFSVRSSISCGCESRKSAGQEQRRNRPRRLLGTLHQRFISSSEEEQSQNLCSNTLSRLKKNPSWQTNFFIKVDLINNCWFYGSIYDVKTQIKIGLRLS